MRLSWPDPALSPGCGPDLVDFGRPADVAPPDVMAIGDHASCRHRAEVPQAENPNIHHVTSSDSLAQGPRAPVHRNTERGAVIPREVVFPQRS
jgi:hypothetical protein